MLEGRIFALIQTPNRWFFIEPQLLAAFLYDLPLARLPGPLQYFLVRWFTGWGLLDRGPLPWLPDPS